MMTAGQARKAKQNPAIHVNDLHGIKAERELKKGQE
jgi:hypothetical protein